MPEIWPFALSCRRCALELRGLAGPDVLVLCQKKAEWATRCAIASSRSRPTDCSELRSALRSVPGRCPAERRQRDLAGIGSRGA